MPDLLDLVIADVKDTIDKCGENASRFDKVVAACTAGRDHFMVTDPHEQIKGVFGALLSHFGTGSKEHMLLEAEIKAISFLDAASRGIPVDWSQLPKVPDDEKILGVGRVWRAIHKGENMDAVRREIEGEPPKPKGAPDWFKNDIEDAWVEFVERDQECSRIGRICSNVEFQRNWLQGALSKLDIGLAVPHPEHPDDIEQKDAKLQKLIDALAAVTEDTENYVPLTEDECIKIGQAVEACGIEGGFNRVAADIIKRTWSDVAMRLRTAGM